MSEESNRAITPRPDRSETEGDEGPVVLETRDLSVAYGRKTAVDRVSLTIRRESLFVLLGRNGAGKSSLIRCLLGHLEADGGEARVLGLDPWRDRTAVMRRVGVVPERPDLPPGTPLQAVGRLCASLDRGFSLRLFRERLERHRIDPRASVEQLSRGQQTLAQLALAMASEPELLVLDDPTLGLDAVARREVFTDLVDELAEREMTVLLTTHDLAAVDGLATDVGFLHEGRLLLCEEVDALKARLRRVSVPVGTDPGRCRGELLRVRRTALGEEWITSGGELAGESMSLEEIFVELVGPAEPVEERQSPAPVSA